ncbi:MAG: HD domain-containing protein, partial [Promethearchaeota archaeon]
MDVLIAAAYLHDLGRVKSLKPLVKSDPPLDKNHALRSAMYAREILKANTIDGVDGSSKIKHITNAILSHSFSSGFKPESIEGMILSDADKLDAMGSVGIIRVIAYSIEHERGLKEIIKHFETKILKLQGLLYTPVAVEMAIGKQKVLESFISDLQESLRDLPINFSNINSK